MCDDRARQAPLGMTGRRLERRRYEIVFPRGNGNEITLIIFWISIFKVHYLHSSPAMKLVGNENNPFCMWEASLDFMADLVQDLMNLVLHLSGSLGPSDLPDISIDSDADSMLLSVHYYIIAYSVPIKRKTPYHPYKRHCWGRHLDQQVPHIRVLRSES